MLIENKGPKIEQSDIDCMERTLSVRFPVSYRQFLLRYNGGIPTPDKIDIPGAPGSPTDVQVFFGIGRAEGTSNLSWNIALLGERCAKPHVLPIGCDSGGNLFCIALDDAGKVIYCDLNGPDCEGYEVAASFDEFITKIIGTYEQ